MAIVGTLASLVLKKAGGLVYAEARNRMRAHQDEKAQRALVDLIDAAAVITETDPEHATAKIAELLDEARPETEEALFEHFRAHMEALEPAAQPYIAKVSAWYITERRARDVFFRRVGRMLVDATAAEVEQVHTVFSLARKVRPLELTENEYVSIRHDSADTLAMFVRGPQTIRESRCKSAHIDQGVAALRRHVVVSRHGDDWNIVFTDTTHDLLERLIRVFA